jgi:hypothetical protein
MKDTISIVDERDEFITHWEDGYVYYAPHGGRVGMVLTAYALRAIADELDKRNAVPRLPPKPRDWWAKGGILFTDKRTAEAYKGTFSSELIHVREVLPE